jgi:hypothetical protein
MAKIHNYIQHQTGTALLQLELGLLSSGDPEIDNKLTQVLREYHAESERDFLGKPATREVYERIGVHRLISLRLLSQLLDNRANTLAPGKPVSIDASHLTQLLFDAGQQFADACSDLEKQFGQLDFHTDLPERIAAEFQIDANEAWTDACHIRAARAYALANKEAIIAAAIEKGSIAA